jgi:Fur family ferric uptake transcriptional regulator
MDYTGFDMQQIHLQEKEQFKKLFEQEKIDKFEDRIKVLETFLQTEQHVTASELTALLEQSGNPLSPEFVHNTLKLLCFYGFAEKHSFDNGMIRYEHRHIGQHHDHMICTKCRKIIEFENDQLETLQVHVAATFGFHMLQHKMEIYGICAECRQERTDHLPLAMAKQGEKLKIQDFTGGSTARMRLMTMGLRIGDEIDVITNMNNGQLVIAADFKRLVLGRGLAQKILVTPVKSSKE